MQLLRESFFRFFFLLLPTMSRHMIQFASRRNEAAYVEQRDYERERAILARADARQTLDDGFLIAGSPCLIDYRRFRLFA